MKKLFIPFYQQELHGFLVKKWWFRAITVIYIIAYILTPFILFSLYVRSQSGWCYDSAPLYYNNSEKLSDHLNVCGRLLTEARVPGLFIAVIGTFLLHYLIQVIFFKIVVNYIVLGGKK